LIVAVHQPQYLPWLGYFDKMNRADVFCYLDNVQYKKNEWQNRNRIKSANGWQWLTVPVRYRFPQKIHQVKINDETAWQRKHRQALASGYGKAPYFKEVMEALRPLYDRTWSNLADLNIAAAELLRNLLEIRPRQILEASRMELSREPSDRLIDICEAVGADTYLAGAGGADYMDLERFAERGVRVIFQDFRHPVYPQRFDGFISHLSVLDLLFNCGPDSSAILRSGGKSIQPCRR